MPRRSTLPIDWVVQRVPADVWRLVFSLCRGKPSKAATRILRFSHVCSSWRGIVSNAPELWTLVKFDVPPRDQCARPRLELFYLILRNSGNMPLTMILHSPATMAEVPSEAFIAAIKPFILAMCRAKYLNLDLSFFDFPSQVIGIDREAGRVVQTLKLNFPSRISSSAKISARILEISKLWAHAPLLQSLGLYFDLPITPECVESFQTSNFPFRQLSVLDVSAARINVKIFFLVLSLTPSLVSAKFGSILGNVNDGLLDDVKLPDLQVLTLRGHGNGTIVTVLLTKLLKYIIAPSLTTLRLQNDYYWSADPFRAFLLKSSPRIEHLHFDIANTDEDEKIECLKLLPFLRTLDLRSGKKVVRDDQYKCLGTTFCSSMEDWDERNQAHFICPNLEKLTIDYDILWNKGESTFSEMVKKRWRRTRSNGRNFEVVIADVNYLNVDLGEVFRLLQLKRLGLGLTIKPGDWVSALPSMMI